MRIALLCITVFVAFGSLLVAEEPAMSRVAPVSIGYVSDASKVADLHAQSEQGEKSEPVLCVLSDERETELAGNRERDLYMRSIAFVNSLQFDPKTGLPLRFDPREYSDHVVRPLLWALITPDDDAMTPQPLPFVSEDYVVLVEDRSAKISHILVLSHNVREDIGPVWDWKYSFDSQGRLTDCIQEIQGTDIAVHSEAICRFVQSSSFGPNDYEPQRCVDLRVFATERDAATFTFPAVSEAERARRWQTVRAIHSHYIDD